MRVKIIVICHSYNGYKDVPFMMWSDDDRIGTSYTKVADGKYAKGVFTCTNGDKYRVFSEDWSAKKI